MHIVDNMKKPILHYLHRRYEKELSLQKITYSEYIKETEPPKERLSHTRKMEEEIILFCIKGEGELAVGAKEEIYKFFDTHSEAILLYGDEDIKDKSGERSNPLYRPDWSPDTFLSRYYLGSVVAVRRTALGEKEQAKFQGEIEYLEEEPLWDLCYKMIKEHGGFQPDREKNGVYHLSNILFHSKNIKKTNVIKKIEKNRKTTVSIIIPSKDQPEILKTCVTSIWNTVIDTEIQIIVIDNGSSLKNREKIKKLSDPLKFEYIYQPMPFHFARMCNIGAEKAHGKHLLFLNDDIQCITGGWLEAMLSVSQRNHAGAVGAKLFYPESTTIQHAGITNLPIGPVHKLQFLSDEISYYDDYNRGVRNVIAVTGACLMIRAGLFQKIGGMCQELAVAFNDVDLCFQLHNMGYYNSVIQDYPLWHHESISRGADESEAKWNRLMEERAILYQRHSHLIGKDPYYNCHLNQRGLDTRILPAYFMGRNRRSFSTPRRVNGLPKKAREDQCLLLRVETAGEYRKEKTMIQASSEKLIIEGYGVVLGSDNSLFKKILLLRKKEEKSEIYQFDFDPEYRNDIEENMPDQKNVGLSGFSLMIECDLLPSGNYQIGMMAKDRTSRTLLLSWSTRRVEIKERKGGEYEQG